MVMNSNMANTLTGKYTINQAAHPAAGEIAGTHVAALVLTVIHDPIKPSRRKVLVVVESNSSAFE
jgi:hypothetical protein